ncbi:hypothetical protein [Paraburkholderia sp. HP33-1]|uniref:hypothetical protein n=1 Tax=Paraburkholderia sp. HP33-1 TaxID=2883243 RepID=UPI001F3E9D14|nr:hypothetical protein [Paraburkholderia sp. HP33-1]
MRLSQPSDKAKEPGANPKMMRPTPEMERLGLDPSIIRSVKEIDAMQAAPDFLAEPFLWKETTSTSRHDVGCAPGRNCDGHR